jgi:riboflavin kinase/FMN adenylyltransferase
VRQLLQQADFKRAKQLLGRPFSIAGKVVYGQQLGRTLGFPTANVNLSRYNVPVAGVYVVMVNIEGFRTRYRGVANIGIRPTAGDFIKPILEIHLLDFNDQIYGKYVGVEFLHKIREEQKFTGINNLTETIHRDVNTTRCWFEANEHQD